MQNIFNKYLKYEKVEDSEMKINLYLLISGRKFKFNEESDLSDLYTYLKANIDKFPSNSKKDQMILIKYVYYESNDYKYWFLDSLSTMILKNFENLNKIIKQNNQELINKELCKFIYCEEGDNIDPRWGNKVLALNDKLNELSIQQENNETMRQLLSTVLDETFESYSFKFILWSHEEDFIIIDIIKLIIVILESDKLTISIQLVYNNVNILSRLGENFINFLIHKLSKIVDIKKLS